MRIISQVLGAGAIVALLAACSGGGSQLPSSPTSVGGGTTQSHMMAGGHILHGYFAGAKSTAHGSPIKVKGFVNVAGVNAVGGNQTIISDYFNNAVYVYGGGGKVNATLTSGVLNPQGITTDPSGTLYVANTGNSNILIFKKPYSGSTSLNDPGQYPVGISVDKGGNIGVTNIISTSGGPGSVSFYQKGSANSCVTVSNSNWGRVYFGAFDGSGNFYVDGADVNGNTIVGVVTGECSATTISTLTTSNTISFPGGIQTVNGNVLVGDQLAASVFTYAPPSGGSLGAPTATTSLSGACDVVGIAIMQGLQNLWGADACNLDAGKWAYPGGGSAVKMITGAFGQPIGVAVNPTRKL